jgi:hypothetical protein
MNDDKRKFKNRIAVILFTLIIVVCYYEFEAGICNYYRIQPFVSISFINLLLIAILAFAIGRAFLRIKPNLLSGLFEHEINGNNRSPILTFFIILTPVILILLSHYAGYKAVGYKSQYPVSITNKNFVMVHNYGEFYILKDYDPTTRKLGDNVIIESNKTLKDVFIVMKTGPLVSKGDYNIL